MLVCDDPDGPAPDPGQFYMLAAAERWGGGERRAPVPAARVQRDARRRRRPASSCSRTSARAPTASASCARATACGCTGPFGIGFAPPRDGRRPLLVGGGVGTAPLAIWQDDARRREGAARLPRRRPRRRARSCSTARGSRPTTARSATRARSPICCSPSSDADPHVEVYACGPPRMLEAVRAICAEHAVPAQLALESGWPAATAPASAASCRTKDGYVRLCVDGPVLDGEPTRRGAGALIASAVDLEHPIINASGTFDAIAARRAFGDALLRAVPVRRVRVQDVTLARAQGNPPPRLYEPRRPDELDRAAQQGPRAVPRAGSAASSPSCPCR